MSIRNRYFNYIEHFGTTVTMRQFFENQSNCDMIALRHDVDHDLDLALEMSYWEKERGIRSTYFILPGARYFSDPRLMDKCLQIQDFGHEVGLHVNILAEWMKGLVGDVAQGLGQITAPFRSAGINLSGMSSHGDTDCYTYQFINYWCFSELRPADPLKTESGLSAEGIPVKDEKFRIGYPASDRLVRKDAKEFPLWSVSMNKLGFSYDAMHVPYDSYFTDSGGGWHRTDDPINHNLRSGRHQILMHPLYWRGRQKIYFFLSTARSGSKWLAHVLDHATPLKALHEFTLNHRYTGGDVVEEKRTAHGFVDLMDSREEAHKLLLESRLCMEEWTSDVGEANVYLECFLPLLRDVFPDASLVHLFRAPRDVVRSIMNRGWYDTPEDDRHPIMNEKLWNSLGQFEKCCLYVRKTNESLLAACSQQITFEKMIISFDYLSGTLKSLGIPFYPRLAEPEYGKKINQNSSWSFPEYASWTDTEKEIFHKICDPVNQALGYDYRFDTTAEGDRSGKEDFLSKLPRSDQSRAVEDVLDVNFRTRRRGRYSCKGCRVKRTLSGLKLIPSGDRHASFLFGGGTWYQNKKYGWKPKVGYYYRGKLECDVGESGSAQLFCLMYDGKGELIAKRSLGKIKKRDYPMKFSFRVRADAKIFNLAVYMSVSGLPDEITLQKIILEGIPCEQ